MNLMMLLDMAAAGFDDRVAFGPRAVASPTPSSRPEPRRGPRIYVSSRSTTSYTSPPTVPSSPSPCSRRLGPRSRWYRSTTDSATTSWRELLAAHPSSLVIIEDDVRDLAGDVGKARVSPAEWLSITDPATAGDPGPEPFDPEAIALLLYTSGTTAAPKAAVLRHRHLSVVRDDHGRVRQRRRRRRQPRERAAVSHRRRVEHGVRTCTPAGASCTSPRSRPRPGSTRCAREEHHARAGRAHDAGAGRRVPRRDRRPERGGTHAAFARVRRRADARTHHRARALAVPRHRLRQRVRPHRDELHRRRARPRRPPSSPPRATTPRCGPGSGRRACSCPASKPRSATPTATRSRPAKSASSTCAASRCRAST